MRLVADTNILFSFFNEKSKARELSTLSSLILYSPEFALVEIETVVNFVKSEEYGQFLPKAKKVSPDPDDVDFFALSFKLECDIWSNDAKLKEQRHVKIFTTKDLVEKL